MIFRRIEDGETTYRDAAVLRIIFAALLTVIVVLCIVLTSLLFWFVGSGTWAG